MTIGTFMGCSSIVAEITNFNEDLIQDNLFRGSVQQLFAGFLVAIATGELYFKAH
jgi:hypothetical protein